MIISNHNVKVKMLNAVSFLGLLSILSCSTEPQVTPLPNCNYSAHISENELVRNFIWRDKQHVTFHKDWQQSSLLEISKRYQYLDRKALPDALKAKNDIIWLESRLNNLENINNHLLTQIEMNLCNNQLAPQSVPVLQQQNAGIDYIRSGLADLLQDIEVKTAKILEAADSK